jgi:hypothetical protein
LREVWVRLPSDGVSDDAGVVNMTGIIGVVNGASCWGVNDAKGEVCIVLALVADVLLACCLPSSVKKSSNPWLLVGAGAVGVLIAAIMFDTLKESNLSYEFVLLTALVSFVLSGLDSTDCVGVTLVDVVNLTIDGGTLPTDPRRLLVPLDVPLDLFVLVGPIAAWLKGEGFGCSGWRGMAKGDVGVVVGLGMVLNVFIGGTLVGVLKAVGIVVLFAGVVGRPDKFAKNWSATDWIFVLVAGVGLFRLLLNIFDGCGFVLKCWGTLVGVGSCLGLVVWNAVADEKKSSSSPDAEGWELTGVIVDIIVGIVGVKVGITGVMGVIVFGVIWCIGATGVGLVLFGIPPMDAKNWLAKSCTSADACVPVLGTCGVVFVGCGIIGVIGWGAMLNPPPFCIKKLFWGTIMLFITEVGLVYVGIVLLTAIESMAEPNKSSSGSFIICLTLFFCNVTI